MDILDNPLFLELFGPENVEKLKESPPSKVAGFAYQMSEAFSGKPKSLTFTMREYEIIWDFIFNCCCIHNIQDPDLFLNWEKSKLECIINILDRKDKLIEKRMKSAKKHRSQSC